MRPVLLFAIAQEILQARVRMPILCFRRKTPRFDAFSDWSICYIRPYGSCVLSPWSTMMIKYEGTPF